MNYVAQFSYNLKFKLPPGIDLEDDAVVESSDVRNMVLHVELVNGETLEIEPYDSDEPIIPFDGWQEDASDSDDDEIDDSNADSTDDEQKDDK